MTNCEIIAVGNELLQGDVLDSNTHWLIKQITALGGHVTRASMLPDALGTIAAEVHSALARQPGLLLLGGGLGPTEDDLTLEAVASALGLPLQRNEEALRMVRATYRRLAAAGLFDGEMTPAREKMAHLPRGAQPLANSAGAAPGVLLQAGTTSVVCLPGVPGEMKAIWTEALPETLRNLFGTSHFAEIEIRVACADESLLAPVLSQVTRRHPEVYIKSRARRLGIDLAFTITLSQSANDRQTLDAALTAAREDLAGSLQEAGIALLPEGSTR
ncbi:MAG: competence/damage-inducible protein A [Anaerolineae bacterium]|jgi:nicotinamide-nucleotide amidase|nr:competence/damage-inducible protein A [Chloroflexota bacterium]